MNFRKRIIRWWHRRKRQKEIEERTDDANKENIFLPYIREILEQVLKQKGLNYGEMKLVLIDGDTEPDSFLEEDEVELCLKQLSPDLNFLTILTDRPAYFREYVETMYEETGLPVRICDKIYSEKPEGNLWLDFEQQGCLKDLQYLEPAIYIPVHKKSWEIADNLDIFVPIGYNTVIVKGICITEKRGKVL